MNLATQGFINFIIFLYMFSLLKSWIIGRVKYKQLQTNKRAVIIEHIISTMVLITLEAIGVVSLIYLWSN